jgi:ubiquinone/menaquinone biosynthesis C-methylase UbiE
MHNFTYQDMYDSETSHFWFAGKQAFITSILKRACPQNARILDIGCGTGGTTKLLTRFGNVTAIESNPIAIRLARSRGITVTKSSVNRLPLPNRTFDVVTILDVLYHKGVHESQALAEAFRVLKPGGMLVVTDCAMPLLTSHHDEVMDAKYRYTKDQLETFVKGAGFRVETIQYVYATTFILFALSRILAKHMQNSNLPQLPPWLNRFLSRLLTWEASQFPDFHAPAGSSLLVIAYKPS